MNYFKNLVRSIFNLNDPYLARPSQSDDTYLVDIRGGYFSGDTVTGVVEGTGENVLIQKIEIKPIDVLKELERVPSKVSLIGIDEKIRILEDKTELISQQYAKKEVKEIINFLKARKRINEKITKRSGRTFGEWFGQFDLTNLEKIENLVKKHSGLKFDRADIFVPEFPDEAIKTMKEYTNYVKKLTGKSPFFYVIATVKSFQKSDKRRDPILLAQSPFGMFLNILGAWDKEMVYLPEL